MLLVSVVGIVAVSVNAVAVSVVGIFTVSVNAVGGVAVIVNDFISNNILPDVEPVLLFFVIVNNFCR